MKKIVLATAVVACSAMAIAQTKPATKPVAKKPATTTKPAAKPAAKPGMVLKTGVDSLSYALGLLDGGFFKQQGITQLNYAALQEGFKHAVESKPTLMTPEVADATLRAQLQAAATKKIQPTIDEGEKFLAENKKRPGVKVTASGLQYEVIKMGTGAMPKDTNVVKVHYTGTFVNGTKFDSSRDRGEPTQFPLMNVIPGWIEGLQLMPVGSNFKFYVPYQLAYGPRGRDQIPGGAMLIFDVELLEILPASAQPQ